MAISEHEQRLLDQIEQGLLEEDPRFGSSINPARMRRRRPVLAITLLVVGLVALVVGVISSQSALVVGVAVSVIGFMIMVAAVGLFVYGQPGSKAAAKAGRSSGSGPSPLTARMEERFRRRFEGQ